MAQFQCKTEMSLGNVRKSKGIQEKCEIQVNFFSPNYDFGNQALLESFIKQ